MRFMKLWASGRRLFGRTGAALAGLGAAIALAACGQGGSGTGSENLSDYSLIITGAQLIDGTGKEPVANTAVYIKDGVIERIDVVENGRYPTGSNVLDARGKFLVPGLVDAHAHIDSVGGIALNEEQTVLVREYYPRAFLFNGVTTVINLSAHVAEDVLALRDAVRKDRTLLLPRIYTGGSNYTVNGGWSGRHGGGVGSVEEIGQRLNQQAESGVDLVKVIVEDGLGDEPVFKVIPDEYLQAIAKISHKHGLPVFIHATDAQEYERSIAVQPRGIVHGLLTPVEQEGPLISALRENGIFIVPTIVLFESFARFRDQPELLKEPLLAASVPDFILERTFDDSLMQASFDRMDSILRMDSAAWARKAVRDLKENTRKMVAAGVRIAVGSDSGGAVVHAFQGYNTPRELEILAECCMTPLDTITAATKTGADMIGRGDAFGTLEPGKSADILILNGNPLENMSNIRNFDRLVLRGELIERSALSYEALKREKGLAQ
jgi:imidazolonepropionase-like amidohydrolase